MSGELEELERWYQAQCNGEWEHRYGVTIGTLDNPGWHVEVDLVGTELEDRAFASMEDLASEHSWISCKVSEGKFRGYGGALMLAPVLRAFLDWAHQAQGESARPVA